MPIATTANSLATLRRVRTPGVIALARDAKKLISWLTLIRKKRGQNQSRQRDAA